MRLVCPNCGAEYEVDNRVIPEAGRDVQCSNCGHSWFQHPEGYEEEPQEPASVPSPDAAEETSDQPTTDDARDSARDAIDAMIRAEQPDAGAEEITPDVGEDNEPVEQEPEPEPEPMPDQTIDPRRRELDDGVRDVLRQEAERESQARQSERDPIETQDELGLEESPAARELRDLRGIAAQERMARLRGLDVEDDTTASGDTGARRDLLPDIEEINSSLAPIGSEVKDETDDFARPARGKGSFRRGFTMMILLAAVIIALYTYAPLISEKVPALSPYMEAYTGLLDQARVWLDSMVKLALEKTRAASS